MAKVVDLPVITTLDLNPERVLAGAMEERLKGVVVIGFTEDGQEYFASSYADGGDVIWHLRRAEHRLMQAVDDMTEE